MQVNKNFDNVTQTGSVSFSDANNNNANRDSVIANTATATSLGVKNAANGHNVNKTANSSLQVGFSPESSRRSSSPTCSSNNATTLSEPAPDNSSFLIPRRHSFTPLDAGGAASEYRNRHTGNATATPMGYTTAPPAVTLVAAALDNTTPAITMTMPPGEAEPTSTAAMLLPMSSSSGARVASPVMMDWAYHQPLSPAQPSSGSCVGGPSTGGLMMRRYSHEIPREFMSPMLPNFPPLANLNLNPNIIPLGSQATSGCSLQQQNFPALPGLPRSLSLPRNLDGLAAAAMETAATTDGSCMSPCFNMADLHLEGEMRGFPMGQDYGANEIMTPGFPMPAGGGSNMPGFPLPGIPGVDGGFMPQLADFAGGQEWLLPLEAFFFSGFQCLESLA